MKQVLFFAGICLLTLFSSCGGPKVTYAEIETDFGNMTVKLYNTTPEHRDNFIKLVKEGFYDDLLFHRIIYGFMIQGGDPNSKGADQNASLGSGGPGYTIPQEIGGLHIKGALSAARRPDQVNPEKESSGSQFYVVQGQPISEQRISSIEQTKGIKYSQEQRELYRTLGGTPQLDNDYTVFGEVVSGMEVIDEIAKVQTNGNPPEGTSRPLKDVKMKIRIVEYNPEDK